MKKIVAVIMLMSMVFAQSPSFLQAGCTYSAFGSLNIASVMNFDNEDNLLTVLEVEEDWLRARIDTNPRVWLNINSFDVFVPRGDFGAKQCLEAVAEAMNADKEERGVFADVSVVLGETEIRACNEYDVEQRALTDETFMLNIETTCGTMRITHAMEEAALVINMFE